MENHKTKLATLLFVISSVIFLGSSVNAYASHDGEIFVCLNLADPTPCDQASEWVGKGNLGNNADASYSEGDSIPVLIDITNIIPNEVQTLIVDWDITASGGSSPKHAFDYITSFDRNDNPDPCFLTDFASDCLENASQDSVTIPTPLSTTVGTVGGSNQPADSISDLGGNEYMQFKIFAPSGDITIHSIDYVAPQGDPAKKGETTQLQVTYTTTEATHVFAAFGVHVASDADWTLAATSITGLNFRVGCVGVELDQHQKPTGCNSQSVNFDAELIVSPPDSDDDGIPDTDDNCPTTPNPDQSDFNDNGVGDACEDTDGDGILDDTDDCPNEYGIPELNGCPAIPIDTDDDGIPDTDDNCPTTPNPDQSDIDQDGIGDACDLIDDSDPLLLKTDDDNDGGDNAWDTRPTFGVSHENREDIIVDNGFRFNGDSFAIVDNHHTPFEEQTVEIGAVNSFTATVYADKDLKVQEFLFGVPEIGMGHLAEMRIEVWFDYTGEIQDVVVNQNSEVIDRASLVVNHQKTKCQESDLEENCDTTFMSAVFLEPLQDKVMAIKAMDFKLRDQTTYLNEGFDVSGDSLNPLETKMIPSPLKGEGLIEVTQNGKYSDYWTSSDGRVFEMNSFGSFKQINYEFERFQDTGDPKSRLHSAFKSLIELEAEKAKAIFDSSELSRDCNFRVCE